MFNAKNLLVASAAMGLIGCGGSDSTPDTQTPPSGGSGGGNSSFEYIVNASYTSKCGTVTPQPEAVIVRHDASGDAVEVYEADENGDITIDYGDVATFSSITFSIGDSGRFPEVKTYVSVTADKILNMISFPGADDNVTQCECESVTFDISEFTASGSVNVRASAANTNEQTYLSSIDEVAEAEVCRTVDGEWPSLAVVISTPINGQPYQEIEVYSTQISDYDVDSTNTISLSDAHLNTNVPYLVTNTPVFTESVYRVSSSSQIEDLHSFDFYKGADSLAFLPQSLPIYSESENLETYLTFQETTYDEILFDDIEGFVWMDMVSGVSVDSDYAGVVDFTVMEPTPFLEAAQDMLSGDDYDFSNTGADNVYLYFSSGGEFSFSLTTPAQGSMSILDTLNFDDVVLPFELDLDITQEIESGFLYLRVEDVLNTTDYLESLSDWSNSSFGALYIAR
ncbi:conserved hypothetical protein [Alteromonas sp. 38]|uniref:hypothetical protein n=1 Tax=Alteromonas TaxID=226 RepID=UPI0012F023A6|nr:MULTISPECIES: hypothetical protein [Alteromonas]CAD5250055.1 conserved hypothetical protein [Alteromonas sp. 154]VXC41154.1 conserved hypothetical protein [Alteromonas sp. 38]